MTVSMRVMSAGDGYKYLLKTVAAADGDRSLSTPLTRYFIEWAVSSFVDRCFVGQAAAAV